MPERMFVMGEAPPAAGQSLSGLAARLDRIEQMLQAPCRHLEQEVQAQAATIRGLRADLHRALTVNAELALHMDSIERAVKAYQKAVDGDYGRLPTTEEPITPAGGTIVVGV